MPLIVITVLAAVALYSVPAPALAQDPPASFIGLLPDGARRDGSATDWMAIDTMMMGSLKAVFPGPRNCNRLESALEIGLNGNGAFESMPDMMRTFEQEQLAQARSGIREEAAQRARPGGLGSLDVVSVGPVREETLSNGVIVFYEYTENCAGRPNATVVSLRGHARRGTTMLSISLLMNTGLADARAKAIDVLDRFAAFDVAAAARGR